MTRDPPDLDDPSSPLVIGGDGQPRSRLYGDIYFSTEDGLAESRAVFLEGCGLPEGWAGRRTFTVGELGLGSGLNILALLDLWRRTRPPGGRLHVFSVEAHPLTAATAARVLSAWPELAGLAGLLTARWPGQRRGFHRVDLPELNAVLDVAVMDVEAALSAWTGQADAWFLDGFSPALNPDMWRDDILAAVAARTAPGGRLATFTVAGRVRRGLAAAGLAVARRPGHGRKRQRLEAWRPDPVAPQALPPRVAVIGAGIAGASMARALRALGADVEVLDAAGPGAGASGNAAALVTPRLDADLGPLAGLFAQALDRAAGLYGQIPGAVLGEGVLQLARRPRDPARFARIAASDLFEPDALRTVTVAEASAWGSAGLGEGLLQSSAQVVRPGAILDAWLGPVRQVDVGGLNQVEGGFVLRDSQGAEVWRGTAVVGCAGARMSGLFDGLPLSPVRGQISLAPGLSAPAVAWGGYVATAPEGLVFGATHGRGEADDDVRDLDHQANLVTLAEVMPELAADAGSRPLEGRASVRAVTPDRLPLAGKTGVEGLHVLSGLGSRGFCLAPLLAEHVAAMIAGAPSPLPREMADLVDPDRFRRRAARRSGARPE